MFNSVHLISVFLLCEKILIPKKVIHIIQSKLSKTLKSLEKLKLPEKIHNNFVMNKLTVEKTQ